MSGHNLSNQEGRNLYRKEVEAQLADLGNETWPLTPEQGFKVRPDESISEAKVRLRWILQREVTYLNDLERRLQEEWHH